MPFIDPISVNLPDLSTAILPDAEFSVASHLTGMNLPAILALIDERLRVLKLSATKASDMAGHPDAIRNMRRAVKTGRHGVNARTLAALESVLEVAPGSFQRIGTIRPPTVTTGDNVERLRAELNALREQKTTIDQKISGLEHAIAVLEQPEFPPVQRKSHVR